MRLGIETEDITVTPKWDYDLNKWTHLADEANLHYLLAKMLERIEALEVVINT